MTTIRGSIATHDLFLMTMEEEAATLEQETSDDKRASLTLQYSTMTRLVSNKFSIPRIKEASQGDPDSIIVISLKINRKRRTKSGYMIKKNKYATVVLTPTEVWDQQIFYEKLSSMLKRLKIKVPHDLVENPRWNEPIGNTLWREYLKYINNRSLHMDCVQCFYSDDYFDEIVNALCYIYQGIKALSFVYRLEKQKVSILPDTFRIREIPD